MSEKTLQTHPQTGETISEIAMRSIIEERNNVYYQEDTLVSMREIWGLVECANARNKAREILEIIGC